MNSATKGRNSKKEKKESSLKRLGVILCIGALVVCLVGGGIYFGPVIARGSKMTQAKKLQREVYGEGIKLMKLAAAGKVESNQFRQTLERGEALEKRLELLKRDFTPEQMSIFEEWLLDFALEEESKLKKRW